MNEEWLQYERKRNAFEKKWKKRIQAALNAQLTAYVNSYKEGRNDLTAFNDGQLTGVLWELYGDVGGYFAKGQYRELGREARVSGRQAGRKEGNYRRHPGYNEKRDVGVSQIKRGSLGFSIDWANKIIERLRISGLNLAQRISEYTRKKVLDILQEAQTENLSLDETVNKITSEVQDINERRAETIARTEVGRAAGEGKMQGAKALGVELDKVWISARDHRTRTNPKKDPKKGDHWTLNEQRRAFDEPFSNGVHQLMQPGDANAPASEVVNCRCTIILKVKKDAQGQPIQRTYFDKPLTGHIRGTEGIALGAVLQEV